MRAIIEHSGQLAFDIGEAVRTTRRDAAPAPVPTTGPRVSGRPRCRHCGLPAAQGWQLCEAHVRALLDELAETRSPFARAA
jgi:hypothetical protein